jgi:tRNA dimethylallyltransferase
MADKQNLIVILGPTAVGKSPAAVRVAEELGGEIISADSRQIYLGMDIGTDKPGPEIRASVPHHLINIVKPDEVFSAGRYREMARQIILRLYRQGKTPVVVGGTGLYLKALLYGLWPGPRADWEIRNRLVEEEKLFGPGHLHRRLVEVDPEAAHRIHPCDQVKTVRALEVAILTGVPLTQHHQGHRSALGGEGDPSSLADRAVVIGLRREREDLYQRIDIRVDEMIRAGLVEEVERLFHSGYHESLPSMQGLGYRQVVDYLKGLYSIQEAVRLIKRDTRRYAKRQMTWFRKVPRVCWVDLEPVDQATQVTEKVLDRIGEAVGTDFIEWAPRLQRRSACPVQASE